LQLRAQHQAREEAMDKYFQELPKTLNSAGLRDEDIEGLNNRVGAIKQYYIQNKDAIRKGGSARFNYEKLIRETSGYVDEGKNKAKNLLELGKLRFQKGNEYIFADPSMPEKIERWSAPIDDKTRYEPLDLATTVMPKRPFDEVAHTKFLGTIKPDKVEIKTAPDPADPMKDIVTQVPVFSPESLNKLTVSSLERYYNNPAFKSRVDEVMDNPDMKGALAEVYKTYFKTDPQDAGEFALAYDLSKMIPKPEKVAKQSNQDRVMTRRENFIREENAKRQAAIDRRARNGYVNNTGFVTGNAMDEFGMGVELKDFGSGVYAKDGYFFDKNGSPLNNDVAVPIDAIPANVATALKAGGLKMFDPYITLKVKNGTVEAIMTSRGVVNRSSMENFQKKQNTEPMKAAQPTYGAPKQPEPQKGKAKPILKGKVR
jgi:hypothetical protein